MLRINRARDAVSQEKDAAARFGRLRRARVLLDAAQILALLIVCIRLTG